MPICFCPCVIVNGERMNFTQHTVKCTIRIQRVWRLSFRHKTTRKLLDAMANSGVESSSLGGMRLDDITARLGTDKGWLNHFQGANRLIFLCQLGIKTKVGCIVVLLRCFRTAYFQANVQINSFVGAAIELEAIRGCSERLIKTFEGILVKIRHAGAAFELAMLSMADVAELNGRLAELCRAFASSSKSKTMLPLYKRCLKTCDCLYIALQEGNSDKRESAAQATVKVSIDFLTKSIKKITPPSDFNSFQAIDVQAAYKEILPAILQNYRWTRAWSLTDFMLHQRLVDPEFAFAAEHESCIACVDAHNRNAELLIDVIQRQLEQCVHALEGITAFSILLEHGACRAAATMKKRIQTFTFREQRSAMRSGNISWDGVVCFMDAAAVDMQKIREESWSDWARERDVVVLKRPSVIHAFVHGLRVLWGIQRRANIHAINASVSSLSTLQSHRLISSSLDDRVARGTTCLNLTREALREVAEAYPTFTKRILDRSTGSRFAFHFLLVAHAVVRRITPDRCPETLTLEGPQLVVLHQTVRRLCDAAVVVEACDEGECEPVIAYIQRYPGADLLPVFMPMSPMSADRAEYALKNKRAAFETSFAKFMAVNAMTPESNALPAHLSFLQDRANSAAHMLRDIVRINRGTHFRLYGRLITELCGALE